MWDSIDFSCGHVMDCNGLGIPGSASHWQMSLGTMALVVDSSFSDGLSQLVLNFDGFNLVDHSLTEVIHYTGTTFL